jgi:hypothetical protein
VTSTSKWHDVSAIEGPSKSGFRASQQRSDRRRHPESQAATAARVILLFFFFFFLRMPAGRHAEDSEKGALGCQRDRWDPKATPRKNVTVT